MSARDPGGCALLLFVWAISVLAAIGAFALFDWAAAPSTPLNLKERPVPEASFRAALYPDGDPEFGVPGPLVLLEQRGPDGRGGGELKRLRWYTPSEASALARVLLTAVAGVPVVAERV